METIFIIIAIAIAVLLVYKVYKYSIVEHTDVKSGTGGQTDIPQANTPTKDQPNQFTNEATIISNFEETK